MNANFVLLLAHSGLSTAVLFLTDKSKQQAAKGDVKGAKKSADLAKILNSADVGIVAYLATGTI